jgi:hypothetical protein
VASWLWTELHDLFDTDDGSLPEVRVDYSDVQAVARGFALLRLRASEILGSFWSKTLCADQSADTVVNAAALVLAGEAEAFHVVLRGIQFQEGTIPDLGVFVFPDQLALDYRMGAVWGAAELNGLFALLADLCALDPGASISLEEGLPSSTVARFQSAWRRYLSEHAA